MVWEFIKVNEIWLNGVVKVEGKKILGGMFEEFVNGFNVGSCMIYFVYYEKNIVMLSMWIVVFVIVVFVVEK